MKKNMELFQIVFHATQIVIAVMDLLRMIVLDAISDRLNFFKTKCVC